jgi:predicted MFS family arabinose efflux permease
MFALGSIPPSGAFVGSLCAGPLVQLLGRRRTLMLTSPVWVLCWSLIALADNYEMMLCARLLTGFCAGLITPSAAVYVSCSFVII